MSNWDDMEGERGEKGITVVTFNTKATGAQVMEYEWENHH